MLTVGTAAPVVQRSLATTAPASRDFVLQGTSNTRQLGGLPTRGGTVRQNMVFRSDALQHCTSDDVARLKGVPIRTVIDFRVPAELKIDGPERYVAPQHVALPMWHSGDMCAAAYQALLGDNPKDVQRFFATLARPESYPVLYHCHSGKDRTGIMSALLLMVLGTPRDQIMDDYMQSQHHQSTRQVDPSWLQGVFKMVDDGGGIDKFLAARGVTQAQLYSVRRLLCAS